MDEPTSVGEWLRRAQAGEQSALEALMAQYRSTVERVCFELGTGDAGDLSEEDLSQEAWLRIWSKLHQFEGAGDDELTAVMLAKWVQQTTRSVVLNIRAARNTQRRRPPQNLVRLDGPGESDSFRPADSRTPVAETETPSGIAMAAEDSARVREAIARISSSLDRSVIRMRFLEGRSLRQIAETLEITYDTARNRFGAALRFLERELA